MSGGRGTSSHAVAALAFACGGLAAVLTACADDVAEPLVVVIVQPPVVLADLPETFVVTSDGSDTCPGFAVGTPALQPESLFSGRDLEPDGSGLLGILWPDGTHARISFSCLGRAADLGAPSEFTADLPRATNPLIVLDDEVIEVRAPMGETVRRDERVGEKESRSTEWYLERDGWLMSVLFMRSPEEAAMLEPVIESVLASWTWT